MTKYNILVQQPRPRAQVYVDENTEKRLVFDFGEASFEQRAKFKQMAEKLTHGSTLTITAPERLVTEHFKTTKMKGYTTNGIQHPHRLSIKCPYGLD